MRYSPSFRPFLLTGLGLALVLFSACGGSGGGGGGGGGPAATTVCVSLMSGEPSLACSNPTLSADGRHVPFDSAAANVVTGDTNALQDVFVRDMATRTTSRVSVTSAGTQSLGGDSFSATLSGDGRFAAFTSAATNLVLLDLNGASDVFLHDMQGGATSRVSVSSSGVEGDGGSGSASLSSDGRFVAFVSAATNLVFLDMNGVNDVFVHDTLIGVTARVSLATSGIEGNAASSGPSISADGRFVAFTSGATNLVPGDSNGTADVFHHDTLSGLTTRVSTDSSGGEANGSSGGAAVSADGRYVTYQSAATNLVPGDTNGASDVFVHDTLAGTTTRVSVDATGVQGDGASSNPSISSDGRLVAFDSTATNLAAGDLNGSADVFVHDTAAATTQRVSAGWEGGDDPSNTAGDGVICAEGTSVVFTSLRANLMYADAGGVAGIFVRDIASGVTLRASVRTPVTPSAQALVVNARPAISTDGSFVVFDTSATDLVFNDTNGGIDVLVHAVAIGTSSRISLNGINEAFGDSSAPSVSADGRWVAFSSDAPDMVAGDTNGQTDVFVRDIASILTIRVSVDSAGLEAVGGISTDPHMAADGRYVAFSSAATNLVPGDGNGLTDVFVRDLQAGTTVRVSVDQAGTEATGGGSASPSVSDDGRYVAFASTATDLVPGDANADWDVFLKDTQTGAIARVSVATGGVEATGGASVNPHVSADGRYVVFESTATNLVAGDTNGATDVFVHDTQTGVTACTSVSSAGSLGNAASSGATVSADGRSVAFESDATSLVAGDVNGLRDVFVHDPLAGTTVRVSLGEAGNASTTGISTTASISADGRFVVFVSTATDFVAGVTNPIGDVFVRGPLR